MTYLNKAEKEIIESYKLDEWISTDKNLKESISNAAKKSVKNKRINIKN